MKKLTIQQARTLVNQNDYDGVIILAFQLREPASMAGVSYGQTPALCKTFAAILDTVTTLIQDGKLAPDLPKQ